MPDPAHVDYIPRIGRGFTGGLPSVTLGEMWDSFMEFRDVYIGNGFWTTRQDDQRVVNFSSGSPNFANERLTGAHIFNKVIDTSGTIQITGVFVTTNKVISVDGSILVNTVAPGDIFFETVKNRLFWAGANNIPIVWNGTTVATWGAAGPIGNLSYTSFSATDINAKVKAGTATVANGSATVGSAAQFTSGSTWVGKTILLDKVEYTIATVPTASSLTLTQTYAGPVPPASVPFVVHYGSRSWTVAPKYAYAYYNPTTGHLTNISPVLTLSETEMTNVAVHIQGIATNSTLFGYGYTKIVIFRTAADGSSLLPLKLDITAGAGDGYLANQAGPLAYTDEQDENQLGAILGRSEGPTINDPAPQLTTIAYHEGRFWGIEEARPWILRYSGDSKQIPLGVAEECWPAENFLPIPSPDGYAIGLKEIGADLLVTTERYTYVVNGSQGLYKLDRIATRGLGTTQYGIAEHPGDSSEQSASAIYVGRDRRLWRHFAGGRIEELGRAIQPYLTVASKGVRHPYRVHIFPVRHFWMMAVGIASDSSVFGTTGYDVFLYDFDNEAWYDWGFFRPSELTTAFFSYVAPSSGDPEFGLALDSLNGAATYLLAGETISTLTGYLRTQPYGFGRPDVKKSMQSVVLEVGDPDAAWEVSAYYDGIETPYVYAKLDLTGTPREGQFNQVTFVPQHGPRQWHVVSLRITLPASQRLYRIQPWFTPESTNDAGTPT